MNCFMPRLQIADVGLAAFGSRRLQLPLITITDLILFDQTLTQQVPACPACLPTVSPVLDADFWVLLKPSAKEGGAR